MRLLTGIFSLVLLFLTAIFFAPSPGYSKDEEPFPIYPCIASNVAFWKKVYSDYTTAQGILHDANNPNIIYAVIDLVPWDSPGAAKINRKLIKLARKRYQSILDDLIAGEQPGTKEEKRVASLLAPFKHYSYRHARDNIRLQIGQKDRFLEGFIRSGAYLPEMKKVFKSYKLPAELVYLPHVESSFNPEAHSKAGAVGLWQFTKSTGSRFMTVDTIVDERYDPLQATDAAARFLKESYGKLGSWPLALTAYNHGQAGMIRAQQLHQDYETIFQRYNGKSFQFASKNFYSEFLAAMEVARSLEKNPALLPDRPEAKIRVRLPGYVAFKDLASFLAISDEDLARLNPSLTPAVRSGKKYIPLNHPLHLPATAHIRKLSAKIPHKLLHASQIRDTHYLVQRGDTVAAIARRYKVSSREIMALNGLDRKATIRIGQRLSIPGWAPARTAAGRKIVLLEDDMKQKPR